MKCYVITIAFLFFKFHCEIFFAIIARYGRDHKIDVEILRYDNPVVKAEVMAEMVVLRKYEPEPEQPVTIFKRSISNGQRSSDKQTVRKPKKRKISAKTNEIQGALALIELSEK